VAAPASERNRQQQLRAVLADDVIDKPLGARRQDETGETTASASRSARWSDAAGGARASRGLRARRPVADTFFFFGVRSRRAHEAAPRTFTGWLSET